MKPFVIAVIATIALSVSGCEPDDSAPKPVPEQKEQKEILWSFESYEAAKRHAFQDNKPFFIYFYADWCGPCIQMQEYTFTEPGIIDYFNQNFVGYRWDIVNWKNGMYFTPDSIKVNSIPRYYIMFPDSSIKIGNGYMDKEEFDLFFKKIFLHSKAP